MGSITSKIADEIKLHGSYENYLEYLMKELKDSFDNPPDPVLWRGQIPPASRARFPPPPPPPGRSIKEGGPATVKVELLAANPEWRYQTILELEKERFKWSQQTFPSASVSGCLFHLKKEIKEIYESLEKGSPDVVEFADAQMMLWDAMQRCGISLDEMFEAFRAKFEKNKLRKWQQRPEGHYEHEKGHHD